MQHYTFLIVSIILFSSSKFNTVTGLSLDKSKNWNNHHTLEIRQFSSTKERPELNSVLSELINEDVKKSIESKQQHINENVTTFKPIILTTTPTAAPAPAPAKSTQSLSIINLSKSINEGLIDQSIALDVAGSENNKQTSRIQTKKGPNGLDYEYEYIYYYYDEDDDDKSTANGSSVNQKMSSTASLSSTSNKSRYTTLDRSGSTTTMTTLLPQVNDLKNGNQQQQHIKGRSSQILNDEQEQQPTNEERLPINTRFPPRSSSSSNNITPAIAVDDTKKQQQQLANGSGSSVKRPSLELVDSHSFNRDDKGNKNGRTFENEFDKKSFASSTTTTTLQPSTINVDSTSTTDITTPLMDKVAFDLYAILANANTDLTTISLLDNNNDIDNDSSTIMPIIENDDNDDDDSVSTTELSYTTMAATTTSTTTTSTTTEAPTTTTQTTTTTTTTTTELPGRKSPFGASGKNRFRFRNTNNAGQSTVDTNKQQDTTTELIHHKSNRFSRPKSGFGSSSSNGSSANRTKVKENALKQVISDNDQQSAPPPSSAAVSTSTFKGRNRGRPNLRASTTTTTSTTESTLSSNKGSSSLRARPSFQLRSRNRPGSITVAAPTTSATISKLDGINDDASDGSLIENDEKLDTKTSAILLPTKPSRFAINRPNRLVGRINNRPTILNAATSTSSDNSNDNASTNNDQKIKIDDLSSTINQSLDNDNADGGDEPSELQQNGLNRLKNRPRLQLNPNVPTIKSKSSLPIAARKINPLVARRKINGKTVTAAASAPVSEIPLEEDEENQSNDTKDIVTETLTGIQYELDVSSETPTSPTTPPRGLGLLGNRRRLPVRRPGTIL